MTIQTYRCTGDIAPVPVTILGSTFWLALRGGQTPLATTGYEVGWDPDRDRRGDEENDPNALTGI
jgi:hypothetical protein